MKKQLLLYTLLLLSVFGNAKTWVINFGGAVGFKYDPDSIQVQVGDIISWNGSFSDHPLESTEMPSGINPINVSTGVSYNYTISKIGTYRFKCSFHEFKCVIIANEPGVITPNALTDIHLLKEGNKIRFSGTNISAITDVYLYDSKGQLVFIRNMKNEPEPEMELDIMNSGVYFLNLVLKNSEAIRLKFFYN